MDETMMRPDFVTEEMLIFLDELRDSGKTNMYGAGPYIWRKYPHFSSRQSTMLLVYLMNTYSERHA